ncbi:high affinity copper uptake protein 1-like [Montipora foliosa]|uniref:high affinity copper uptake protein 1-like n=1 Tax=Montipora foliosa TaxID=591990 RepID=UPI0035F181FD
MDHHHHHPMTTPSNFTGPTTMNHHGDMMMMYFHFSKKAVILFEGWSVDDVGGMIGSCIGIFILAALYEGLKVLREILKRKYSYVVSVDLSETKTYGTGPGQTVITESRGQIPRSKLCNWHHFLQTFLHIVQVTLSYFLMLIFMTYNVWLCLSVALGAGFGYFVFGWKVNKVIDIYEHCH